MPQAKGSGSVPPGPGRPGMPGGAARPGMAAGASRPGPPGQPARPTPPPPGEGTPLHLVVDDSNVNAGYANFCRVLSTAEELIVDLGLNPNPPNSNVMTVKVSQRIIMNHFTAKRLMTTLSMAIQQHEQAFGPLELNISRRLKQPAGGQERP